MRRYLQDGPLMAGAWEVNVPQADLEVHWSMRCAEAQPAARRHAWLATNVPAIYAARRACCAASPQHVRLHACGTH